MSVLLFSIFIVIASAFLCALRFYQYSTIFNFDDHLFKMGSTQTVVIYAITAAIIVIVFVFLIASRKYKAKVPSPRPADPVIISAALLYSVVASLYGLISLFSIISGEGLSAQAIVNTVLSLLFPIYVFTMLLYLKKGVYKPAMSYVTIIPVIAITVKVIMGYVAQTEMSTVNEYMFSVLSSVSLILFFFYKAKLLAFGEKLPTVLAFGAASIIFTLTASVSPLLADLFINPGSLGINAASTIFDISTAIYIWAICAFFIKPKAAQQNKTIF